MKNGAKNEQDDNAPLLWTKLSECSRAKLVPLEISAHVPNPKYMIQWFGSSPEHT